MKIQDIQRVVCLCCDQRKDNIEYIKSISKIFNINIELFIAGNGKDTTIKYDYIDRMSKYESINDCQKIILRQAMIDGLDNILILEDDITFTKDFIETLSLIEIPENWDSIALGAYSNFDEYGIYPEYDDRIVYLLKPERIWGFFGIIIHKNVFRLLTESHISIMMDNILSNNHCNQYVLSRPIIIERPLISAANGIKSNKPIYNQAKEDGRIFTDKEIKFHRFPRIKFDDKRCDLFVLR